MVEQSCALNDREEADRGKESLGTRGLPCITSIVTLFCELGHMDSLQNFKKVPLSGDQGLSL